MGVGRRMKKQGPPAPLDESKITSLNKRKASNPAEPINSRRKKRRSDRGDAAKEDPHGRTLETALTSPKRPGIKIINSAKNISNTTGRQSKLELPTDDLSDEGEDEDELAGDEFDDIDGADDDSDLESKALDGDSDDASDTDPDDSAFDSEEEEEQQNDKKARFSEDEDGSGAEEHLTAANIEGLSRRLDAQTASDAAQAQLELQETALQTNIAGEEPPKILPDGDEDTSGPLPPHLAPDLHILRNRITDTIRVLDNFSTLSEPGRPRSDYTSKLLSDISTYYNYNPFVAEKLLSLFPPLEAFSFFEANETPRPVVIRTNTLRTNRRTLAQALINRGVVLEPLPGKWSKVGLQIFSSPVPLGATPEYLAGHYILQAASSFLPVIALAPQEGERILDMAAAPGGKTTYVSALMRNTGSIFANDANRVRAKGLIGNIHRLGCKNVIVSNLDAQTSFPKILGGFDRILLDAPCSGTGVIAKDPSVKTSKTEKDFIILPETQKKLLLAAIDSTDHKSRTGGYVVYSTCSVTVEENEQVVQYALNKRPNVRIVETGLTFGTGGFKSFMGKRFHQDMAKARRYYPHQQNMDGFFVCKLKKFGPTPTPTTSKGTGATTTATATAPDHTHHIPVPKAKKQSVVGTAHSDQKGDHIDGKVPSNDTEEVPTVGQEHKDDDGFGDFDDDEDAKIIEQNMRKRIKRKGLNPKAVLTGKRF